MDALFFRNNHDGSFTDATIAAGLGQLTRHVCWGAAFVDYDNDAWPDIFYVTGHVYQDPDTDDVESPYSPRVVLRNLGDGRFADVSDRLGPGVAERRSSRGSAYADYDNDGDVDVLVLNVNDPPSLLRNDGEARTAGSPSSSSAPGATARRSGRGW